MAERSEGGAEDIVSRLEALRRRTPPRGEAAAPPPPEDRRRRLYRAVGVALVILIVAGIFLAGYKFAIKPMIEKQKKAEEEAEKQRLALLEAKNQKIAEIERAFSGLPERYYGNTKAVLKQRVEMARTVQEVRLIDVATPATEAWRSYLMDEAEAKRKAFGEEKIVMIAGNETYKGYSAITAAISVLEYPVLSKAIVEKMRTVFVPVRLSREQAAGGFGMPGDYVSIYYRNGSGSVPLVTDAKIVAVLRAASQINLNENENRLVSGQGGEAKGEGSVSTGGVDSLTGPISIGMKQSTASTTYTVDLSEVQRAAAASKIEQEYIERVLRNYGIRLSRLEIESQLGDFDEEYLILLEVREEEARALISRYLSGTDREKLMMVLSRAPGWVPEER